MISFTPHALFHGLRTAFFKSMSGSPEQSYIGQIAGSEPSDGHSEKYIRLDSAPAMQEVLDQFSELGVGSLEYEVTNRKFGVILSILRDHIEDDRVGIYGAVVRQLGLFAARHPNQLVVDAYIDGDTATGYDGVALFSASHTARGKATAALQDNIESQTGTTTANIRADIHDAIERMAKFEHENGLKFHGRLNRFAVFAPVALRENMRQAVLSDTQSDGMGNVGLGNMVGDMTYQLYFDARLDADSASDFYVINLDAGDYPVFIQERSGTTYEAQTAGASSDTVFEKEKYRHKIRARRNNGYKHWQYAVKVA